MVFAGGGDAFGEMLLKASADCLNCKRPVSFGKGVKAAQKAGITDDVVMCSGCKSVFKTHMPGIGRLVLTEDVTAKYKPAGGGAPAGSGRRRQKAKAAIGSADARQAPAAGYAQPTPAAAAAQPASGPISQAQAGQAQTGQAQTGQTQTGQMGGAPGAPGPNDWVVPAGAGAIQATPSGAHQGAPENPTRALALAGAVVAAMLLSCVAVGGWSMGAAYPSILEVVVLACAAYLVGKQARFFKVAAGVVAGAGALALVVAACAQMVSMSRVTGASGLLSGTVWRATLREFVVAAAVVVAAWAATKATEPVTRPQTTMAGLFAGGAYLVAHIILAMAHLFGTAALGSVIAWRLPQAIALGLAVKVVAMLCLFKSPRMTVGVGPKVWFWICLIAMSLNAFASGALIHIARQGDLGNAQPVPDYFVIPLNLVVVVGYILLVRSQRLGYILVLLGAGVNWFAQLTYSLDAAVTPGLTGQEFELATLNLATLAPATLNPVITGLALLAAWKTIAVQPPVTRGRVRVIFKIGAITALVAGLVIFLALATTSLWDGGNSDTGSGLTAAVAVGGTIAIIGLFAVVTCFDKRARFSRGLAITALILGALPLALVVISLIMMAWNAATSSAGHHGGPEVVTHLAVCSPVDNYLD
ncbi:MAG: hypothetical protein LBS27_11585 [Bifidobacteriaceae bacterium]|jgi:hypothetical protein|nr:hypothetical protein [Bifidobacteriaceae bacterium]